MSRGIFGLFGIFRDHSPGCKTAKLENYLTKKVASCSPSLSLEIRSRTGRYISKNGEDRPLPPSHRGWAEGFLASSAFRSLSGVSNCQTLKLFHKKGGVLQPTTIPRDSIEISSED